MFIEKIHAVNFGILKDFYYTFDKGIYLFSGDNGQGKTTVLKILYLVLLDDYAGELNDYINWDSGVTSFLAEVWFSHRGHRYFASVKRDTTSTERVLEVDNDPLLTRTGQEAINHLKLILDPELTKASMIIREQQLNIVNVKPAERRDHLKRIYDLEFKLQLSRIDEKLSTLKEQEVRLQSQLSELYGKTYDLPDEVEPPMTEKEFVAKTGELDIEEQRLGQLHNQLGEYQVILATRERLIKEKECLLAEAELIDHKLDATRKQIVDLPKEYEAKRQQLKFELEESNKALGTLVAPDIEAMDKEIQSIVIQRVPAYDEAPLTELQRKEAQLQMQFDNKANISTICPTCGNPLKPEAIQAIQKDLEQIAEELKAVSIEKKKLLDQKELIRKANEDNNAAKEKKYSLIADRDRENLGYQRTLNTLVNEASAVNGKLANLESELNSRMDLLRSTLSNLTDSLNHASDRLRSTGLAIEENTRKHTQDVSTEISATRDKLTTLKSEIQAYQVALARADEVRKQRESIISQREADNKLKVELSTKLHKTEWDIGTQDAAKTVLKTEFPIWLISKIVRDLETNMNEFIARTYGSRYKVSIKDKKTSIPIVYGPKDKDISVSASGFERQVFGIAYMYGLSKQQNLRALWMDEADSSASDSNSQKLYQVIGDGQQFFDQIFIVSHKEKTKELLENDYHAKVLTFNLGSLV